MQGLYARYRSEVGGNEPQLTQGSASQSSGGSFQSAAELTAAMRDPRYANDPAIARVWLINWLALAYFKSLSKGEASPHYKVKPKQYKYLRPSEEDNLSERMFGRLSN